jgi:lysophospholipase L1-like esterase
MKKLISFIAVLLIFLPLFAQNDSLRIVAFGNSTTAFRKGVEKVYSVRLQEKLLNAGIDVTVINAGVGSSHTGSITDNDFAKVRHGMDRFEPDVLAHSPHWVIINFGLNDAYQDQGSGGKPRIPLNQYRKNIVKYIHDIEKQGGKVILLTPNPLGSNYEQFRIDQVEKYANCVRAIARDQKVALVDSWKLFSRHASATHVAGDIDFLYLDGIHPNDLGHELIAEALYRLLAYLLSNESEKCLNNAQ